MVRSECEYLFQETHNTELPAPQQADKWHQAHNEQEPAWEHRAPQAAKAPTQTYESGLTPT